MSSGILHLVKCSQNTTVVQVNSFSEVHTWLNKSLSTAISIHRSILFLTHTAHPFRDSTADSQPVNQTHSQPIVWVLTHSAYFIDQVNRSSAMSPLSFVGGLAKLRFLNEIRPYSLKRWKVWLCITYLCIAPTIFKIYLSFDKNMRVFSDWV